MRCFLSGLRLLLIFSFNSEKKITFVNVKLSNNNITLIVAIGAYVMFCSFLVTAQKHKKMPMPKTIKEPAISDEEKKVLFTSVKDYDAKDTDGFSLQDYVKESVSSLSKINELGLYSEFKKFKNGI